MRPSVTDVQVEVFAQRRIMGVCIDVQDPAVHELVDTSRQGIDVRMDTKNGGQKLTSRGCSGTDNMVNSLPLLQHPETEILKRRRKT